jgi:glycosyltransferase involved in cell wall biosynthesis
MRVFLVSGEYPPLQGGVGDFTHELGKALQALGVDVEVVTSVTCAEHGTGLSVQAVIERWSWGCWGAITRLVERQQPDVVNVQYQAAAYGMHPAINFLPHRLRVPVVTTFHDLKVPYLFPKAGPLRGWVVRALAQASAAAITTNPEDTARAAGFLPEGQLREIPIGSNIDPSLPPGYDREAWRARWGAGPDTLLLCYFGFLNESKGGVTLVHTLAQLKEQVAGGPPPRLLMVGGQVGSSDPTNVAYLEWVKGRIVDLGLADQVEWTGYLPDAEVSASLLAADVCVLPYEDGASYRRGSFMAALAHGLPIVTTHPRVSLPELVSGRTVLLVRPGDASATAAAVSRVWGDPALQVALREGARRLAQRFAWDQIALETLAVFEDILHQQRRNVR